MHDVTNSTGCHVVYAYGLSAMHSTVHASIHETITVRMQYLTKLLLVAYLVLSQTKFLTALHLVANT